MLHPKMCMAINELLGSDIESMNSDENISASRLSTFIKNTNPNRNTITTTAQQHQLPISVAPPPVPPPPPPPMVPVTPTPTRPSSRANTMCKEHFFNNSDLEKLIIDW